MATSAFKSTTKRAEIGGGSSSSFKDSSSSRSLRRSRSLSRFSHPISSEPEPDYIKNVPRGKFVNTERGSSAAALTDISLDDLAMEFFSSSSLNENESDGGKEREGRSVFRRGGEVGRWASDTASSRRRVRSVSRSRGDATSTSMAGKVVVSSSVVGSRGRSVSRSHGDTLSSSEVKKVISSSAAGSQRRMSLSVARHHQISDSESEVDLSRSSRNHANVKVPIRRNGQASFAPKSVTTSNQQLGRSRSHKDLSMSHDGYSSHSSVLTDEESKDVHFKKNGFEKIIRTVYAKNKTEHPSEDVADGGLYDAMRKEVRHAVQEVRTELNQAMGRSNTTNGFNNSNALQDFSGIRNDYATKLEQLETNRQDLLTEMLLEERGHEIFKKVRELPDSRTSAVAEKPSRTRKRSNDRNRMSARLNEEAERYFEDFISNIEDTDLSSFDGERSDSSSTLGGTVKASNALISETGTYKSPAVFTSRPIEMDGIILPWLQWETSGDGSFSSTNKTQTPITPKSLQWDSEKDVTLLHDPSSNSNNSSHGSWSPGLFSSPAYKREDNTQKTAQVGKERLSFNSDMDEYLELQKNEELVFEMYRERNRINSGGLLLCGRIF